MKELTLLTSLITALLLISISNVSAQNEALTTLPKETEDKPISTNELIKLATKAPLQENFSNQEDYLKAKEAWVRENPNAYARIVGKESSSAVEPRQ